jgi:hypothetical protein
VELVDIEISRQSWDAIPCGCGRSARHVGELLRRVARGEDVDVVHAADNHVWSSPVLYSPAPAAAEVALAALADDLPQQTREQFLRLLHVVVGGEGTDHVAAAAGLDLPGLCEQIARCGMWLLYRELMSARSADSAAMTFELLAELEPDRERLRRVQIALSETLPSDLRRGALNDPFGDEPHVGEFGLPKLFD